MDAPGSRGYDADPEVLARRYEEVRPEDKLRPALHLLPDPPARVLDVGAGSGVDAAWFASRGHEVVAVEPSAGMRRQAGMRHASARVEWLDDALPALRTVVARAERFGLVLAAGVWHHLDGRDQPAAIATLSSLLEPAAILVLSIRHGAAPSERRSFPVRVDATVASAAACGLKAVLNVRAESLQPANRAAGITWTWLAFRAPPGFLRQ